MRALRALLLGASVWLQVYTAEAAKHPELVYVDDWGVIRWRADQRQVALFGANYCLPSASDYRAAEYLGADRKKRIDQDMAHLARMGWDGLRLALWGDWENCDRDGNLIVNEHSISSTTCCFARKNAGSSCCSRRSISFGRRDGMHTLSGDRWRLLGILIAPTLCQRHSLK